MSRASLRERQRQLREDAILDAAYDLLIEQGYAAMNMDDLAARAGVSKATLYQHFPSKDELVVSVILRLMRRGEERIGQIDPTLPPIQRLEQILQQGLERRINLWAAGVALLPPCVTRHPDYQEQHQRMIGHLHALIDAAKEAGDIDPALATPVVAQMLLHLFRMDYADLIAQHQCSRAEIVATLLTVVFDGLSKGLLSSRTHDSR